ncbi:MAG: cation:dicarboxylase symporter family transporter [candidate division Zixibacteria bacterium]|nr:cation:dicarboxylase symporter family transporter [candidate division Zixibacteria bacterium]
MFDRNGKYLIFAILLGMILGVVFTAVFGEAGLYVKFLGDMFLSALKMIVIPLLFCSMIVGISNLGDVRKLGRTGAKTMLYFLATSTVAVIIGLILVNIVQPGVGASIVGAATPEALAGREAYSFFDWITKQIPSNIIAAAAETQVLPVIIFALFFGGVLTTIGSKGRPVIAFFEGVNQAIMKIVQIIMWFAPIGIFGLVAGQLASVGGIGKFGDILFALGKYSLVVIAGLLIHGLIILPLFLRFKSGKSPLDYFTGMSQALMTAFATASSSATLPVTMKCVEEKNDIDKRASSFVLPLGATINMDGTALYEAVAALFIAQAYGIDLSILGQITICLTAVLASVGAAGIPQAGLVTMVLVLQAVNLPLEGIGLILAVDWFLDRCRTTVNVWGDSIGAAVIASTKEIGLVDRRRTKTKSWDSRGKSTSRQDNTKSKRTRSDSRFKSKDKKQSVSAKSSSVERKSTRRTEATKKNEHKVTKRAVRKVHKVEVSASTGKGEVYRPDSGLVAETAIVSPVKDTVKTDRKTPRVEKAAKDSKAADSGKKPAPSKTGEKKSRPDKSKKSDKPFGRKRSPVAGSSKPEKSAETKPAEIVAATEKTPDTSDISLEKVTFEVPKFPKSILDDLAAIPDERIEPSDEIIAVEKPESLINIEEKSEETVSSMDDKIEQTKSDDFSESTEEKSIESTHVDGEKSKDFSQLDKAVLGPSEKPDKTPEKQEDSGFKLPAMMVPDESDTFVKKEEVKDDAVDNMSLDSEAQPSDSKAKKTIANSKAKPAPKRARAKKKTALEKPSKTLSDDNSSIKEIESLVEEVKTEIAGNNRDTEEPPQNNVEAKETEKIETSLDKPVSSPEEPVMETAVIEEPADDKGVSGEEEIVWGRTKRRSKR